MDQNLQELADQIGFPVPMLRQLLQQPADVDQRVLCDLFQNVLFLMRAHRIFPRTAIRMMLQTPDNPFEVSDDSYSGEEEPDTYEEEDISFEEEEGEEDDIMEEEEEDEEPEEESLNEE